MADDLTQEQRQEILHRIWWDFTKVIAFFSIGWILFIYGTIFDKMLLMLLGMAVAGGPVGLAILTGAKLANLLKPDYEVVTKDGNGNVISRDGGAQSSMNNLFVAFFLAVLLLIVGIIIQFIRAIILAIKYAVAYAKVTEKPPFIKGITLIILIGFVTLIGAPAIFGSIHSVKEAAASKAYAKEAATNDYKSAEIRDMIKNIQNYYSQNFIEYTIKIKGQDGKSCYVQIQIVLYFFFLFLFYNNSLLHNELK
jgi:hypothetical protein